MSDNLSHFLVDLASNPDQMRAYLADPARVLESASLNADERAAMLSCDSAKIRDVLHAGPGDPTGESKAGKKKKKKGSKTKKSKKSIKKK